MLRGIHKASSNWLGRVVMGVLLGLIAISFGIWGIGDIFRGFGQSTVAKVGGTEIRVDQFRQLYQDRLQQLSRQTGRPVTQEQARMIGLDRQLLAQVITEAVLDERARELKLGLTDQEVARRVIEDPTFRGISGQFDRAKFEYLIRQIGYTEQRFMAEQRRGLLRQQLVQTVSGSVQAPKTAVDSLNRYQNEQRTIDLIRLGPEQAGEIADPSPEVLTKYFEDRKVLFRSPEYRKLLMVTLTPAEVEKTLEISDADVKKYYEERRARFETPERRHLRQIVFPNADEAKAAAEKIAKGTTFEALAAERGLKDTDTDLGTLAKAGMVDRAVADAAFALKEGGVSAPVEGRFGTVLIKVEKIEPAAVKKFEEVADELRRELMTDRSKSELLTLHDKVEDERLGGMPLADIAKKFNLQSRTVDAIDRSGRDPAGNPVADLPQNVDLLGAAFRAPKSAENDPLTLPQSGGYVWYEVLDVTPARDRTFDEVKDQLLKRWRDDQIAQRLKTKAEEILEKIKGGASFHEAAAAFNVKPEWLPGLKRNNPPQGVPARAMETIFSTPKDVAATADGSTNTERLVFRVSEITVPELNAESEDAKRMQDELRRAIAEDLLAQYVSRLETEVGVSINQAALNQITGASPVN